MIVGTQNGLIPSTSEATIEAHLISTDRLHTSLSRTEADTTSVEVLMSQQKSGDTKNRVTMDTTMIQKLHMVVAQIGSNSHLG